MAYIFSTDILKHRMGGGSPRKIREFCSFVNSTNGVMINICARLAQEVTPSKTIKLGYDAEANKMIIVSALDGDLKLCKSKSMSVISCTGFLKALGIKKKFNGRYEAYVDEDMNIVIDLNKPLPEDEQSKKKK